MRLKYYIKEITVNLLDGGFVCEPDSSQLVTEYEIYLGKEYLGAVDTEERAKELIEAHIRDNR
jgi:hypothetical protein